MAKVHIEPYETYSIRQDGESTMISRLYKARGLVCVRQLVSLNQIGCSSLRLLCSDSTSYMDQGHAQDSISLKIQDLFCKYTISAEDISAHIDTYISDMNLVHIANFIFRAGRRKYTLDDRHLKSLTNALRDTKDPIGGLHLGQLLYGLRTQSSDSTEVGRL